MANAVDSGISREEILNSKHEVLNKFKIKMPKFKEFEAFEFNTFSIV